MVSKENSRLFRALLHFLSLAAAAAVIGAGPASAQVYKWVDERGVTHYGEHPPQRAKASEVPDRLGSPAPPGSSSSSKPPPAPDQNRPSAVQAESDPQAKRREQCNQQRELLSRLKRGRSDSDSPAPDTSGAIARQEKLVAEQCQGL